VSSAHLKKANELLIGDLAEEVDPAEIDLVPQLSQQFTPVPQRMGGGGSVAAPSFADNHHTDLGVLL
jgi:hypothetical protein